MADKNVNIDPRYLTYNKDEVQALLDQVANTTTASEQDVRDIVKSYALESVGSDSSDDGSSSDNGSSSSGADGSSSDNGSSDDGSSSSSSSGDEYRPPIYPPDIDEQY